jgi:hypothetical protein
MDPGRVSAKDDPRGKVVTPREDGLLPLRSSLGVVPEPRIQVNGHGWVTTLFTKAGVGWKRPRKRPKELEPQTQGKE